MAKIRILGGALHRDETTEEAHGVNSRQEEEARSDAPIDHRTKTDELEQVPCRGKPEDYVPKKGSGGPSRVDGERTGPRTRAESRKRRAVPDNDKDMS